MRVCVCEELSRLPGWHQVIAIDNTDERFDLGSLLDLLLAHLLGDLAWIAINACYQTMRIRSVGRALVVGLQVFNNKTVFIIITKIFRFSKL